LSTLGRRLLRLLLLLLLQSRVRVGILGGAVSLRGRRITLGRSGVPAAVGDRRIDVGLAHGISATLRRAAAVLRRATAVATAPVAAVATASEASSATRPVVGSLVDSNRSAVKLDIVHRSDGILGIRFLVVPNKAEAAASSSVSILDHDLWGETFALEG